MMILGAKMVPSGRLKSSVYATVAMEMPLNLGHRGESFLPWLLYVGGLNTRYRVSLYAPPKGHWNI